MALSSYTAVQSNVFVEIIGPSSTTRISDRLGSYTLNGQVYTGLGSLLGITQTDSELRVSPNDITVTLTGIPNSELTTVLNAKIKGSKINIYRGFFNASTGVLLSETGNPFNRFKGFINNFSLQEEYDNLTRSSSNTILFTCSSYVDIMSRKFSGRRTNPENQKKFFPSDVSMDRVPALENTTFDFGVVK